jgi:hypothetical protein
MLRKAVRSESLFYNVVLRAAIELSHLLNYPSYIVASDIRHGIYIVFDEELTKFGHDCFLLIFIIAISIKKATGFMKKTLKN